VPTIDPARCAPLRERVANESSNEDLAVQQEQVGNSHQQIANVCTAEWNALHDAIGSFADGHSTF
jgi:hypothetical protein